MTLSSLFIALSRTLIESAIQALVVWMVMKALLLLLPGLTARIRYTLLYIAFTILSFAFISTLLAHLQEMKNAESSIGRFIETGAAPISNSSVSFMHRLLTPELSMFLTLFYVTGLFTNLIRLFAGVIHTNRILNYHTTEHIKIWDDRLQQLAQRLNLRSKVKLYFSHDTLIPFTTGFIKPLILFPVACVNQLSTEQVEAILLHELAHIKRHDYLLNLLQQVMSSILFFNPFAVLISREISELREYCCDDVVKTHTRDVQNYASALLVVEENRKNALFLAMASNGTRKYSLLTRIKRIMMNTPEKSPLPKLAIFLTLFAITISVAWNIPTQNTEQKARKVSVIKTTAGKTAANAFTDSVNIRTSTNREKLQASDAAKTQIKFVSDTTVKKKNKIKIIIEDDQGNKQEYSSLNELPQDMRMQLLNDNFSMYKELHANKEVEKALHAQSEKMKNFLNGAEWQDQQEALKKHFNSAEWKKQQEKMMEHFNSPEWKKQQEGMMKHFSSPEWKKQQEEMMKHFNSPEWKKQQEGIIKHFNSPEWKKLQEEMIETVRKTSTELERLEKPEKPEQPEQAEKPEQPEKPEKPENK